MAWHSQVSSHDHYRRLKWMHRKSDDSYQIDLGYGRHSPISEDEYGDRFLCWISSQMLIAKKSKMKTFL